MRKTKWAGLLILVLMLTGCSSMKVEEYRGAEPKLDLFAYFEGKTYAWGQFQDRSGKVLRRFTVDIDGQVNANQLTLDERFVYDDGENQQRIWRITRIGEGRYVGEADDVVGQAQGESAGNALNWRYTLDLPYKDSSIHVRFDDWMFLHPDRVMLNRAEVSKWGFKVGEVTLFFSKQPLDGAER
ncbi:MAG: DUF3833 domain-containing protein [Thiomicrorhabdus chilensis]|uniref:DUF3833 domain-containing protein n=1 Tax=Thiomicrorhabdus chilensis TaxID=63656 RepID=UPI00299D0422|nr:DUF3833 domain-containing protein [Thiomicrorhabdus chilensis]MDX1347902.1 DUF3833 domain-containing protein [Thiomicrorhabdus chilensis]